MYANSGLARIYLTSREAYINGLIGLPQGDNLFKDTVSFNQLLFFARIREGRCVLRVATFENDNIAPHAGIANFEAYGLRI